MTIPKLTSERRHAVTEGPLRQSPAWKALERHHPQVAGRHLRVLFAGDPSRGERLVAEVAGIYLDYSKHRVTDDT